MEDEGRGVGCDGPTMIPPPPLLGPPCGPSMVETMKVACCHQPPPFNLKLRPVGDGSCHRRWRLGSMMATMW